MRACVQPLGLATASYCWAHAGQGAFTQVFLHGLAQRQWAIGGPDQRSDTVIVSTPWRRLSSQRPGLAAVNSIPFDQHLVGGVLATHVTALLTSKIAFAIRAGSIAAEAICLFFFTRAALIGSSE
jgi:hypothetical protein